MKKKKSIKRIGILTGGGDCPGLNAVIRAVTKTAIHDYGLKVLGIEDGYEGLLEQRAHWLSVDSVSGILTQGGTILGTSNTANPFKVPVSEKHRIRFEDHSAAAVRQFKAWKLDALITVGGDGTQAIAEKLSRRGIPVIGIPKTIDNDLSGTDFTFGFDTAVSIATDALDRLHTTAASHHRIMILEVMGRHAGWIALYAGAAGGADIILIPEKPFELKKIAEVVGERAQKGRRFSLIIVAEGAFERKGKPRVSRKDIKNPHPEKLGGIGEWLAKTIETQTGLETRAAVLGHIQRGGTPTAFDRNLGTLFGKYAVKYLCEGTVNHMIGLKGTSLVPVPLKKVVAKNKAVPENHPLVLAAASVGTSFGC